MSSQKEDGKGESGKESTGGFGWFGLVVTAAVSWFIGIFSAALYFRVRAIEGPQCNISASPSTSANTVNETFRDRPLTCEPCGICLDDIQLVVTLPCGHRFHANCFEKWIKESGTCPICRMKISPDQIRFS